MSSLELLGFCSLSALSAALLFIIRLFVSIPLEDEPFVYETLDSLLLVYLAVDILDSL